MTDFEGKIFVILGATSGVGSSVARTLISKGASLLLLGRNEEKLNGLAKLLDRRGHTAKLDVESDFVELSMCKLFDEFLKSCEADGFDGGVYCSGISPISPLRGTSQPLIQKVFAVNTIGAFLFAKTLASKKFRKKSGRTSIVLVSSVRAHKGEKGLGIYGASKAALSAFSRSVSKEIAPYGCRINCISPGWLDTAMNRASDELAPGLVERMKELHPLGLGSAEDVASSILFLLSDEARWITGSDLVVDGGFLA